MATKGFKMQSARGGKARSPDKRSRRFVFARIRMQTGESLIRNSGSLILNTGMTAAAGYGSLALLVHIYSIKTVGLSTTAMSGISLVVAIMQFGVNLSLPRYLPTVRQPEVLVNTLLTAMLAGTVLGSIVFLMLPTARQLFALGGFAFAIAFVVSACIQTGAGLFTTVMIAGRQSHKLVSANVAPNILKVGMPYACSVFHSLGAFISRTISAFFLLSILSWTLVRKGYRFRPTLNTRAIGEIGHFTFGAYIANIIGGLPMMLLPIIVLSRIGAKGAAYWGIAIMVGTLLYQVPSAVTQALLPEMSHRPQDRRKLLIRAAFLIHGVMVPLLLLAYIAAPVALEIFGHSYVSEAVSPLRWIIIAGFSTGVNYISGAILFLAKKTVRVTVVNTVNAIVILGMAIIWATSAGDVGIAWAVGDAVNVVLFASFAYLAIREVGGRLEALGGEDALATERGTSADEASLRQSFDILGIIAERQRVVAMQEPYLYQMTEPQGLYSMPRYQQAEREYLRRNGD